MMIQKSVALAINCIFVICHFNCVYIYERFFKKCIPQWVCIPKRPLLFCVFPKENNTYKC